MREITNDDMWSAIRGLRMWGRATEDLKALIAEHAPNPLFASQVIAKAATQILSTRTNAWRV